MVQTVLVVEPDVTLRGVLCDALQASGLQTVGITSFDAAPALILATSPDLVLLDCGPAMPEALEVIRAVRADSTLSRVPLIILSERASSADRIAGLQSGADDYIVKPFDLDELLARVGSHLRRSQREQTLNPLTRLPGHAVVESAAQERLARGLPFGLLYVDMDHFKAYNDYYSFAAGDRLILDLGQMMLTVSRELSGGLPMAHIGGDDFLMLIADPDVAGAAATRLISLFSERLPSHYAPEDYARGYVELRDRQRRRVRHPLVSLSVAVVPYRGEPDVPWGLLASRASELKQSVKSQPGHGYLVDRRRLGGAVTEAVGSRS